MKTEIEIQKLCDAYNFIWATRRVAEERAPVSRMIRKKPNKLLPSSGWFFLSSSDEENIESADEIQLCSIERVLEHSPVVADYLHLPPGSQLHAELNGTFTVDRRGAHWWEFWRK
jgi:hypothetical protein